jgi:hypothetical protein
LVQADRTLTDLTDGPPWTQSGQAALAEYHAAFAQVGRIQRRLAARVGTQRRAYKEFEALGERFWQIYLEIDTALKGPRPLDHERLVTLRREASAHEAAFYDAAAKLVGIDEHD